MAVTMPDDVPMVAVPGALLVHAPPVVASVSVMTAPTHMPDVPTMGDIGFTLMSRVAVQAPMA